MSDVMKVLTVTVDADTGTVSPDTPQTAGVRGDNRALRLVFRPLSEQYRYQLEIVDGSGGYDVTLPLSVLNGQLEYDVPVSWTAPGTATVRLIVLGEGEDPLIRHYAPLYLYFADREDGSTMGDMLPRWQTVMTEAESAAQDAGAAAEEARQAAFHVGAAQTLKGVYIGSGDLPDDYAVQIDPNGDAFTMDEHVDAASENPVKNRAVAEETYALRTRCTANEVSIADLQKRADHQWNSGDLLTVALSLPSGIHAVQNLQGSTPFQYVMAIVCRNGSDRCTVYCYGHNGLYMNNYADDVWQGWKYCAATAVEL